MKELQTHRNRIIRFVKKSLRNSPLIDDLGDYIPLLAYYKEDIFCRKQILESMKHMKKGLFFGKAYPFLRPFEKHIIIPEMNTDALLGLIDYYRLSGWETALDVSAHLLDSLKNHFTINGEVCWFLIPSLKIKMPFTRGVNGVFIELLVDMYEITEEDKYLEFAGELASTWLKMDFFRKYSLFPSMRPIGMPFFSKFGGYFSIVKPFKHNTSIVNGLVSLYRVTQDTRILKSIIEWTRAIERKMFDKYVFGGFDVRSGKRMDPELQFSFPIIDLLCDIAHVSGSYNLLDLAERIAGNWLEMVSSIDLLPNSPFSNATFIDSVTDFSVSLFRLHELTGKKEYLSYGKRIALSNMLHHKCKPDENFEFEGCEPCYMETYNVSVDVSSGNLLTKVINPKFVALLLKPIIYMESGKKIYNDDIIFKLMRDR
ncbi:MAG: hypothetical protein HYX24_00910 [Candidatus Aenigmarchaeota archaeon]|nr:hypothetical protein [Candidatus Aenigmarchaeota archaeon]